MFPSIGRLLAHYDVEHARLSYAGGDLSEVGGGYCVAWVSDWNFDGGRVFAQRRNVRAAIDAMETYHVAQRVARGIPDDVPWWRWHVGRDESGDWPSAPQAYPDCNQDAGPVQQTAAEVARDRGEDDRLVRATESRDFYLKLWRRQNSQILRLMTALGASAEERATDPDAYLYHHHRDKFPPEFAQAFESRRVAEGDGGEPPTEEE
jgi:hypothetical protein